MFERQLLSRYATVEFENVIMGIGIQLVVGQVIESIHAAHQPTKLRHWCEENDAFDINSGQNALPQTRDLGSNDPLQVSLFSFIVR